MAAHSVIQIKLKKKKIRNKTMDRSSLTHCILMQQQLLCIHGQVARFERSTLASLFCYERKYFSSIPLIHHQFIIKVHYFAFYLTKLLQLGIRLGVNNGHYLERLLELSPMVFSESVRSIIVDTRCFNRPLSMDS